MRRGIRGYTAAVCALVAGLAACTPQSGTGAAVPPDGHTSRNALDWSGAYEGVLPCADCPGIRTRLTLHPDGRYDLLTETLGRPVPPRSVQGRFAWQPGGNVIALDAAGGGQRYAVGEGRLSLLDGEGRPDWSPANRRLLTRVRADLLQAQRWTLEEATDARGARIGALFPAPDRRLTFRFADGRLNVTGGCNTLAGGYASTQAGELRVSRLAGTIMACEPPLMQTDTALTKLLAGPLRMELSAGPPAWLRLVAAGGETLRLVGTPTPESLYGAPTRVFLEVAPTRVPCRHPLMPAATCLQVRERFFDQNGLRSGEPGPWRPLLENIEGYTHMAGVRNVVRVNRYTRSPVPADASAYVYVLDLVVESETMAR